MKRFQSVPRPLPLQPLAARIGLRALLLMVVLALASASWAAAEAVPSDWTSFQEGVKLFGERRLGEALDAFKRAIELRSRLFADALRDIDAISGDKALQRADDSLSDLIQIMAPRDVIRSDLDRINSQAKGSLLGEIRLLRSKELSFDFGNFLRASELVIVRRGDETVGDSFSRLRESAKILASYPEAEYWIGKIFLAEGETRLAELQFLKAYDERAAFDSPDEAYPVLEALAELHRDAGRLNEFEADLLSVANDSVLFAKKSSYLRLAMERTLSTRGIDALMALYRLDEAFPLRAYSELGEFYLEDGRSVAVTYLMAAVDTQLSRAIAAITAIDPVYEYSDLGDLLDRMASDRDLSVYAHDVGLYRDLELLGEALSMGGYRRSARGIWQTLANRGGIEPWNTRAAQALVRPVGSRPPYPLVKP